MRWFWLSCLVFASLYQKCSSYTAKVNPWPTCEKQRKVFTNSWGIISDGTKQYPEDSYCEWLIRANTTGQVITLKFIEMETECSYDHIYVYDGDSYSSNLLGSFSGNTIPKPVTATSGAMLILLYSDTNYAKDGFKAEYSITNCPMNCSEHGICIGYKCKCFDLWSGLACDVEYCPNECNQDNNRGRCHNLKDPPRCICNRGYSGQSCSLPHYPVEASYNKWHILAQEGTGLSPRAGHSAAYVSPSDTLYVFGGLSFGSILGDFMTFNFSTNQWRPVDTLNLNEDKPAPRWGHTMISYGNNLVMFGGELADGSLSNELWLYNIAKQKWRKEADSSPVKPPPVTKHTMTLVEDHWIYIFGGSLEDGSFSSLMYAINLNESDHWMRIVPRGGKEVLRRLVGHTTVYHAPSKSLVVFGGLMVDFARFSKLSYYLHIFHIEKKFWSRVYYPSVWSKSNRSVVPLERAFHSAVVVGDYLVIYGGYAHRHSYEEICYDKSLFFYHLGCHTWVDGSKLILNVHASPNPIPQGVIFHSMNLRLGHTLIITGGYSGSFKGTLLAFVLPFSSDSGGCHLYKNSENCIANLNCGWHKRNNTCEDKTLLKKMSGSQITEMVTQRCPGLCPTLKDCHSCLVWGEPGGTNMVVETKNASQPLCGWCVQAIQCHSVGEPPPPCSVRKDEGPTPWWGPKGTDLNHLEECQILDKRPGMTFLKYRYPPNWNQPDEVHFINQTGESLSFHAEFSVEKQKQGPDENVARMLGYIHPLGAKVNSDKKMKMETFSKAVLKISTDDQEENLEVVANHTSYNYSAMEVKRFNKLLFKNDSLKQRYLTDFRMFLPALDNATANMNIIWNAFKHRREEKIPLRFLEPYRSGKNCQELPTCLACNSDIECGWCQATQQCLLRGGKTLCHSNRDLHYLVTTPEECTGCGSYIDCESCVGTSKFCEWLVEDAHCTRRGRFPEAVKEIGKCPNPCHMRYNCTSCLGDPGRCAWCEEQKTCFLFATYTTAYMFGRCREWMDEDRRSPTGLSGRGVQCKDCSRHTKCKHCLSDLGCGWCSTKRDPTVGACVLGDFGGPESGDCAASIAFESTNVTNASEAFRWSYATCPDVNECKLGLAKCHENATCINTKEGYQCKCKQGFKGNGDTECNKTCSKICKHGVCSEEPDFKCVCELGWSGEACEVNCGCNNHSTCKVQVGVCDECHNNTQGISCEMCRPGSYGNPLSMKGCQRCECNGHEDDTREYCNNVTGSCYCSDNTEGFNCERCKSGFYGNPRNGGYCYLECGSRQILRNVTWGSLGSHRNTKDGSSHCLWILTEHSLNDAIMKEDLLITENPVILTIHSDMNVTCPHNHVYVYDGLPEFVVPGRLNKLLGAYCGSSLKQPIIAKASSSILTIYYEAWDINQGFNATFERVPFCQACTTPECRKSCVKGSSCPNCSSGVGSCYEDYGICRCKDGFGGIYCTFPLLKSYVQWTLHYDPDFVISNDTLPLPRMGHTLIAHNRRLWLFGGYSTVAGELNDTFIYDVSSQTWEEVNTKRKDEVGPFLGRHFHGSALVDGILYIYGGINNNNKKGGVLGDFWKYTLAHNEWSPLRPPSLSVLEISELAGLTLTSVDRSLILIGGYSPKYGFLDKVLEYEIDSNVWREMKCEGSYPVGIYGHTSVYHNATSSIYVFGGYLYDVEKPIISNILFAFHLKTKKWSRLPPDAQTNQRPPPRYFHSSVIMDNYILIMGGRNNNFSNELLDDIYIYNINCNTWVGLRDVRNIGQRMIPNAGASATIIGTKVYLFGGYNGQTLGQLISVHLPKDICRLYGNSGIECVSHIGCSYCSVFEKGDNRTSCFSRDGLVPSGCYNPKKASEVTQGRACERDLFENINCSNYKSCLDCLSSFPVHSGFYKDPVCQWCSNCQVGHCVKFNTSCEKEITCNVPQIPMKNLSYCPLSLCVASDCEKCYSGKNTNCKWTQRAGRSNSGDWGLTVHSKVSHWCCIWSTIHEISKLYSISSASECPKKCHEYKNCSSCRRSVGAEGGWHECYWSEALQECLSPSYEMIRCEGGNCGAILKDENFECPIPCWQFDQAATCLMNPNCGWCAFGGEKVDGRGVCMGGGILGPTQGSCNNARMELKGVPLPKNVIIWWAQSNQTTYWNYLLKPKENECLNSHHDCDSTNQECVDTEDGYRCQCKANYTLDGDACKPVCQSGCDHGNCNAPDICKCHFGYVGKSCSTKCRCNGHSDCMGPKSLTSCIHCYNNTIGPQCEKCKTLFVGDPIKGEPCIPCKVHCNGHSNLCLGQDILNSTFAAQPHDHLTEAVIRENVKEGSSREAICLNCQNHTEGDRCDVCTSGYFKAEEHIKDGCRLCECHGHGDTCNILNGENCICHNNTENDRQCSQKNVKNSAVPCWKLQCSKCKEYYLGVPTDGHQCYQHMFLDKDCCFGSKGSVNNQEPCLEPQYSILQSRSAFFAVQPRYMNVNIRITVDVAIGGIDLYLSAKEDTFVIDVNKTNGVNIIQIDQKYTVESVLRGNEDVPDWFKKVRKRKRQSDPEAEELIQVLSLQNLTETFTGRTPLLLREIKATGLTTYVTLKNKHEFLLVRSLQNRLVITIPQEVHDLRTTRFYIVLHGVGNAGSNISYGNLFFRQDQTRIDLFVFFSVFFSCFFLFLAICVVVWKVKQALDIRQARRLHVAEMKHMASRPFAHVCAVIEDEPEEFEFLLYSPMNYRRKPKHAKGGANYFSHHLRQYHSGRESPSKGHMHNLEDKIIVRPVAMEPTYDGGAAVCTTLIQLPGGMSAPVRICLGSSLVTLRTNYHFSNSGIRAVMRRRASHVVL